ncbi:MAG: hypothetical protein ABR905_04510 [Terracidiphilus sp.]
MKILVILFLFLVLATTGKAADKNAQTREPIVWGALSHSTGCVIFAEGHKTKGMFWGVAVTTTTMGKLTVVESQNYTLDQKEYLETQETMDDLMQRAQRDRVKFVKIPEKYSPDQLEKARGMCMKDQY